MATVAPALAPEGYAPDPQARVLASLLRSARVSLLLGAAPTDRAWADSVLPLLCRRAADRAVVTDAAYSRFPPVPERRRRAAGAAPGEDIELVVCLDDWTQTPLDNWRRAIDAALAAQGVAETLGPGPLADALADLGARAGLRFLFLFDRFDSYLAAPSERDDVRAFADEWVRTMSHPACAAHVMVALDDDADLLMQRFRHRIPALGDHWLRLDSRDTAAPAANDADADADWSAGVTALVDRVARASRDGPFAAPAGHGLLCTADVYESVESMLARVAALNRQEPWHGTLQSPVVTLPMQQPPPQPPPQPSVVWAERPAEVAPAPVTGPRRTPVPAKASPPARSGAAVVAGVALAVAALVCAWFLSRGLSAEPQTGAAAVPLAANPAPTPPVAAPRPRLLVRWGADDRGGERVVQDLARSIGAPAGLELVGAASGDWTSAWKADAAGAQAGLALLRYEALQAARQLSTPPALQVVAPLFAQELQLRVRVDSPLRYIHQIEGQRIDVGSGDGERALTAAVLYRRMFIKPLPAGSGHASLDQALQRLRAGQVDVVLWVGAGPASGAAGTRLLTLDKRHPASRRALQAFLPGELQVDGARVSTLASLLFLVAPTPLEPAQRALMTRLAQAWCQALPELRRDGDPKWRDFQPGLSLDTGWPAQPEAAQALRQCAAAGDTPRAPAPPGNTPRWTHPGA